MLNTSEILATLCILNHGPFCFMEIHDPAHCCIGIAMSIHVQQLFVGPWKLDLMYEEETADLQETSTWARLGRALSCCSKWAPSPFRNPIQKISQVSLSSQTK